MILIRKYQYIYLYIQELLEFSPDLILKQNLFFRLLILKVINQTDD